MPGAMDAKLAQPYRLINEGKLDQALSLARRLVQQHPAAPEAAELMRVLSLCRQEFDQAVFYARRLAELRPTDPHARADLATTLVHARRADEGVAIMEAVVKDHPDQDWTHALLVAVYSECGRFGDAERAARSGLALHPHHAPLTFRLAAALMDQGRAREGNQLLQELLVRCPDDVTVAMQLATTSLYEAPCEPARVAAAHMNYGRLLDLTSFLSPMRHARPASGSRRTGPLRVALLSSDFRRHSVASFVEPLLEHLDRKLVRPMLYYTKHHGDEITDRLRSLAERGGGGSFATVGVLDDEGLARRIAIEKADVLIDLNGISHGHRLGVMRLKPAPVQVTFCGYPATTGLRTIDYRLVDSITDPPGHERYMAEQPLRLDPCFLCFKPLVEAPVPGPLPALAAGHVTFGSFNMILKINDGVVQRWSALLARVPGSRLAVKSLALSDPRTRERLARRFVEAGAPEDRVEMIPPTKEQGGHLSAYGRIDIALDTFPYTGTTTTCEALYMGVPVVTLCPPADRSMHAGRVSASLLGAAGLPELVAETPEGYVELAAKLAADLPALSAMRAGLRDRLEHSPLMDGPGYARRFEALIIGAWSRWAAGAGDRA